VKTEDISKSAWAWFEAMDRTAIAQQIVMLSLGEQIAIKKTPEAMSYVKTVVTALTRLHELCADSMNQCDY
jgi:hypothetical protein